MCQWIFGFTPTLNNILRLYVEFLSILPFSFPLKSHKPIEPSLLFLLSVSGLIGLYAFFFFVWSPAKEEPSTDNLFPEVIPVSELVLEQLPEALGQEEISPGVPKRRFPSDSPLSKGPKPILPITEPKEEGTIIASGDGDSSLSGSSSNSIPQLSFVGIDPDIRKMEIPVGDEPPVDLPENMGLAIKNSNYADPPISIRHNNAGQSLSKHFYNMPISGNKILFIVEAMNDWTGYREGAILALENELQRAVDSLSEDQMFNIWAYSGDKLSLCNKEFMSANGGNKTFSIVWIKSYFTKDNDQFIEANTPIGYPSIYSSQSGLTWGPPLLLALDQKPESIFLLSSTWKKSSLNAISEGEIWTDAKQAAWQAAMKETQDWIDEENRKRALEGIPHRAIFNLKKLVARRHPQVAVPPALPRMHEDKIYSELKEQYSKTGISNLCPIYVVLHPPNNHDGRVDIKKFSNLVTPYKGGVYWVR